MQDSIVPTPNSELVGSKGSTIQIDDFIDNLSTAPSHPPQGQSSTMSGSGEYAQDSHTQDSDTVPIPKSQEFPTFHNPDTLIHSNSHMIGSEANLLQQQSSQTTHPQPGAVTPPLTGSGSISELLHPQPTSYAHPGISPPIMPNFLDQAQVSDTHAHLPPPKVSDFEMDTSSISVGRSEPHQMPNYISPNLVLSC